MASVASWGKQSLGNQVKVRLLYGRSESMLRVVPMLHADVARDAQVEVFAFSAGDEVLLGVF